MNKIGNDKTHLDIEENRLYSMTFRMRYERLFIPIDTYQYLHVQGYSLLLLYSRGKTVIIKRNIFDVCRLCQSMLIPVMLNLEEKLVFVSLFGMIETKNRMRFLNQLLNSKFKKKSIGRCIQISCTSTNDLCTFHINFYHPMIFMIPSF